MVTLWHLLLGICFCVGVASALTAARDLGGGYGNYALALLAGSCIGSCAVWVLSRLATLVAASVSRDLSRAKEKLLARGLYLFALFSAICVGILAEWVTSGLVQTVIHGR